MEILLAGGVAVDLATRQDLDEHHRRVRELFPERPRGTYYTIEASGSTAGTFAGSGPIALVFEPKSPPAGQMWFLQWVAVFLSRTPAAGAVANLNAAVMVGRAPGGPNYQWQQALPNGTSDADVVIPGQAVPGAINVPDKTIVKPQKQLYVVLAGSGLAASTFYVATAGVVETPDSDEALFW